MTDDEWEPEPEAFAAAVASHEEAQRAYEAAPCRTSMPPVLCYTGPWRHAQSGVVTWNFYRLTMAQKLAIAKAWLKARSK